MESSPRKISLDVHTHLIPILPDELHEFDGVQWDEAAHTLTLDGEGIETPGLFDPAQLISWMDANSIERAWASAPPPAYRSQLGESAAESWAKYLERGLLSIESAYPDRLAALTHLPVNYPKLAAHIAKGAVARGRTGFSLPTGPSSVPLDHSDFDALWRVLSDHGAFVLIHPGASEDPRLERFYLTNLLGNPYETALAAVLLVLGGVTTRFPDISFCLVHCGGLLPAAIGRVLRGVATRRPGTETAPAQSQSEFRRFLVDSVAYDSKHIQTAMDCFGEDSVVFGSDWPFSMGMIEPHAELNALESEVRRRVMYSNALRLL